MIPTMMNGTPTSLNMNDLFMSFGSVIATAMFVRAMYEQYMPYQWREGIQSYFGRYTGKLMKLFSPYLNITFEEYTGDEFSRSDVYTTIETYLSENSSTMARGFKASSVRDGTALVLGLGDYEEVTDEFRGVKVWWKANKHVSKGQMISWYPGNEDKRFYQLSFHNRHRKLITESYLRYILDQGKAIEIKKRQRKLFTNVKSDSGSYHHRSRQWTHVEFKHPASFSTLAMEPSKKQAILTDLERFSNSKDYYAKIGKPWKRGYLLYGPPGTGKSTMIAAIANFLEYDVYDLELTAVKDNTQLRRLLIDTSSKSIIVIEDIDCSLDLTGQRSKEKKDEDDEVKDGDKKEEIKKKMGEKEDKKSEVTLSGLLNFIDGIWSGIGEERLIIFTTNYIDKLDPALIRRGRMDFHIELGYCCYEAFKVLARNYLDVDEHPLFEKVKKLLEETEMTPADVAENLMPKTLEMDPELSLSSIISELEKAKENERLKAEQEEKEKEEKAKIEQEEKEKKKEEKEVSSNVEEDEKKEEKNSEGK